MADRFPIRHEVEYIHKRMKGYQHEAGTYVLWFRFNKEGSVLHPVYDEGTNVYDEGLVVEPEGGGGGGLDWYAPFRLPVMSAIREEGPSIQTELGLYTTDAVHLVISFDQMRRIGFSALDLRPYELLRDRFIYDRVVFKPNSIQVRGQIEDSDTVVGIDAFEVDPDELVNEWDFFKFYVPSNPPPPEPPP